MAKENAWRSQKVSDDPAARITSSTIARSPFRSACVRSGFSSSLRTWGPQATLHRLRRGGAWPERSSPRAAASTNARTAAITSGGWRKSLLDVSMSRRARLRASPGAPRMAAARPLSRLGAKVSAVLPPRSKASTSAPASINACAACGDPALTATRNGVLPSALRASTGTPAASRRRISGASSAPTAAKRAEAVAFRGRGVDEAGRFARRRWAGMAFSWVGGA